MREALKDPEVVYERRWLTLLVLCISLIVITLDNTILNVAHPDAGPPDEPGRPRRHRQPAAVDRRRLHPRVRRAAAHRRAASATGSAATGSSPSGSPIFGIGSAAVGVRAVGQRADRDPRADGHRRRVHHAVDAVDHHQRLHRPGGAGQGDRRVGRRLGARHRARPDHRRLPARALLVGLDLHRQRADRDRRAGARLLPRARVDATRRTPRSTRSARCCRSSALGSILWAVIEAPSHGWGVARDRRRLRRSASCVLGAFFVWELRSSHPMLDMHFFENPRFSAASGAITLVFLVAVRHAVPADAVPAVGARLLHRRRRARCCCRRRRC